LKGAGEEERREGSSQAIKKRDIIASSSRLGAAEKERANNWFILRNLKKVKGGWCRRLFMTRRCTMEPARGLFLFKLAKAIR